MSSDAEEVLTAAIKGNGLGLVSGVAWSRPREAAEYLLAAMPDYTIVRKDEIERWKETAHRNAEEAFAWSRLNAEKAAEIEQLRTALASIGSIAHLAWTDPPTVREAFERIEALANTATGESNDRT